jgi:phospholipid N-methyltransferase
MGVAKHGRLFKRESTKKVGAATGVSTLFIFSKETNSASILSIKEKPLFADPMDESGPNLNLSHVNLLSACRYDFDKDGYIRKEDVHLILSHVPIDKTMMGAGEGRFTSQGGGG